MFWPETLIHKNAHPYEIPSHRDYTKNANYLRVVKRPLFLPVSAVRTDFSCGLDRLGAVRTNLGFRHVAHDFIWLNLPICEFPFRMTDEEVEQRADEMEKHDGQHPAGFLPVAQALVLDRAHEHPDPKSRQ